LSPVAARPFPAGGRSLLHAVGLPELVTDSLEQYEALALEIARDSTLLSRCATSLAKAARPRLVRYGLLQKAFGIRLHDHVEFRKRGTSRELHRRAGSLNLQSSFRRPATAPAAPARCNNPSDRQSDPRGCLLVPQTSAYVAFFFAGLQEPPPSAERRHRRRGRPADGSSQSQHGVGPCFGLPRYSGGHRDELSPSTL